MTARQRLSSFRPLRYRLLASLLWLLFSAPAFAQAIDALRDTLQNEANTNAEAERARRDAARARAERASDLPSAESGSAPAEGGPCFTIREIRITGHEPFGKPPSGHEQLIGTCATAADIARALGRINAFYQEEGFITTRAYLPEQDVSDGSLEISVIPGRIEGYAYGDGRQADRRLAAAFPAARGDLLNLREIEQGLDNFNAPRSASAKFQLVPGQTVGGSFVQVLSEDERRFQANLSTENTGFKSTGVYKGNATVGIDNLIGINDQLSFSLSSTPFDPRGRRYSDALSVSALVPYGNWSLGLDAGTSRYAFTLDGINQAYPVSGRSQHVSLTLERLISRDSISKLHAYGGLKFSRSLSFIDSYEIQSQRQRLAIGSLGLRGETFAGAGKFGFDATARFGIEALGSEVPAKSAVDPDFKNWTLRLTSEQPLGSSPLTYKGVIAAQLASDILPASEQFSIGGWSSVRGFHDDNMYGASGIYFRNTLEWLAFSRPGLEARLGAGLDVGWLKPSPLRQWDQRHLIGVSLSADVIIRQRMFMAFVLAHALDRPSDFDAARTIGFASLDVRF
ncbi:ShlB/FhaC/HecB family hemolysin secretion/activation protein [Mesorhizobium plurifarium]|uniref:ShlB/FhaC/HecB family hemolysin secretion/activation protein n=1 Tax=Sinorhizobium arboris TaxID=76745 RepID=UPI0004118633|nr:ShlB/FhaC/HecB family hemolysin secretion/activation protein [Sinorhizobium arboris]PST26166.1 ShlB/FhaC/HecB family hemolysin secretion/activation protein [Mesorhizobium plurifarium]